MAPFRVLHTNVAPISDSEVLAVNASDASPECMTQTRGHSESYCFALSSAHRTSVRVMISLACGGISADPGFIVTHMLLKPDFECHHAIHDAPFELQGKA